ncbi:hypothetical protein [Ligilactobacillus equi]|uniref:hypothetical protein n=1 Tax=Ligilactobacillus equi TaxID=137357 RepID=UPI000469FA9B|nr:hypothetical protein [Ligilactobacillus equi]
MSNEATITANIKVTGLSSLVQANEAAEKLKATLSSLNGGGASFSGLNNSLRAMENHIKRITTDLKELNTAGNQSKVGNNLAEGMTKANEAINKTKTSLKEIGAVNTQTAGTRLSEGISKANTTFGKYESSIKASQSAERELANAAKQVASAEKEATSAAEKGANARKQSVNANNQALREEKQAQQAQASMMSAYAGGGNGGKKEPGKFMSALKESVGMFTLGQLGANAVMGGVEGIKNVFKGGLDYISTQQASQVSWASNARSVNQLLGRNISNKQANNFASGMVTDVGNLARSAGNDYKQVSDAALAFYATGAGVSTAGNKKKTLQLTNDMLNLQDAGGLNDEEMGRFIQSVAKSLDQDKIDGKRLQQLKQFNPNIDEYLNKAYKKRTGHDAKSANDYTGDDLVNAIHAAGTAPGVADASRRMNQSLAGVQRSIKYGSIAMAGEFEKKLATSLNKAFGGDGKLFSKITGWMNDPKKTSAFVNKAAETTSGVITTTGKIGREAWNVGSDIFKAVQPYAKSFGQGFVSEIKSIASGVKSAYGTLKGYASKLSNLLPKDATNNLQGLSNALGKITGGLVGLRFLNKLPGMSGLVSKMVTPVMNLIGKIPVVGKTLSGVISKITGIKPTQELSAAGKMQSAADTMMSAANRMNGGNGNNRLGNEINGPKGNRAGMSLVDSNGRVIDIADGMGGSFYRTANGTIKRTFKGNGNFSGTFNPYLGMDYVPGTKLGTRMGRYHNGRVVAPAPRSTALIAKGEELLESATAAQMASESSRVARRVTTGIGGRASLALTKLKGNTLIKLGNAGQFVASHGGNFIARGAIGIKNGLGALGKSGAGLNLAFGAIDLANSFATTKSGTLARHKAVGGSIGATSGSIAGGALGTLLGPAGTMIGATAGGMLGNVIGNWAGGLFGGSKTPTQKRPSHGQQVATAQAKAQENFDRKNYANDYATRFGVNSDGTQKSSAEIKSLKLRLSVVTTYPTALLSQPLPKHKKQL